MKKLVIALLVPYLGFSAGLKVGVFDLNKVFTTIEEGKVIKGQLEDFRKTSEASEKTEDQKFAKIKDQYIAKFKLAKSDVEKKDLQKKFNTYLSEYQKVKMGNIKKYQELKTKLTTPVLNKIKSVVGSVTKKEGISLAFRVEKAPFYADQKDITDLVIENYNMTSTQK